MSRATPSLVPVVALYCCSTGAASSADAYAEFGGDGGFADRLRDALCVAGGVHCTVDAHTTAGHTTMNPYVRRFEGRGSRVGGVGGFDLVSPKSGDLWRRWRRALRETSLRYRFPVMSVAEIHDWLLRPQA
jgi:hypothetical protein